MWSRHAKSGGREEPTEPLEGAFNSIEATDLSNSINQSNGLLYLDPTLHGRPHYVTSPERTGWRSVDEFAEWELRMRDFPLLFARAQGGTYCYCLLKQSLRQRVYRTLSTQYSNPSRPSFRDKCDRANLVQFPLADQTCIILPYKVSIFCSNGTCILVCVLYRTILVAAAGGGAQWTPSNEPQDLKQTNKKEKKRRSFIDSSTYGVRIASCSFSLLYKPPLPNIYSIKEVVLLPSQRLNLLASDS